MKGFLVAYVVTLYPPPLSDHHGGMSLMLEDVLLQSLHSMSQPGSLCQVHFDEVSLCELRAIDTPGTN